MFARNAKKTSIQALLFSLIVRLEAKIILQGDSESTPRNIISNHHFSIIVSKLPRKKRHFFETTSLSMKLNFCHTRCSEAAFTNTAGNY